LQIFVRRSPDRFERQRTKVFASDDTRFDVRVDDRRNEEIPLMLGIMQKKSLALLIIGAIGFGGWSSIQAHDDDDWRERRSGYRGYFAPGRTGVSIAVGTPSFSFGYSNRPAIYGPYGYGRGFGYGRPIDPYYYGSGYYVPRPVFVPRPIVVDPYHSPYGYGGSSYYAPYGGYHGRRRDCDD
jgi:hypothetical protein